MPDERPSESVQGLPPPVSEVPWSTDFVMQAIEILPVAIRDGVIVYVKPAHADSFIGGWPAGRRSEDVAAEMLARVGLQATVLHSTSWRQGDGEMIITYIAVVDAGSVPEPFESVPVVRAELARGEAATAPSTIAVAQVLEHALRHLAWLVKDDPVISEELTAWNDALSAYVPEPFRSLQ